MSPRYFSEQDKIVRLSRVCIQIWSWLDPNSLWCILQNVMTMNTYVDITRHDIWVNMSTWNHLESLCMSHHDDMENCGKNLDLWDMQSKTHHCILFLYSSSLSVLMQNYISYDAKVCWLWFGSLLVMIHKSVSYDT